MHLEKLLSDISGMVKPEDNIRPQDDFAAAVNKDYTVLEDQKYMGLWFGTWFV